MVGAMWFLEVNIKHSQVSMASFCSGTADANIEYLMANKQQGQMNGQKLPGEHGV